MTHDPSGYGKGAMQPCQPGQTVEWEVPRGIELWFDAVCLLQAKSNTGNVTFGSFIRTQSETYYPIANNGFHTANASDMFSKTDVPLAGVLSFFGQTSCGTVCMRNDTDKVVNVMLTWRPRTLREVM